MISSSRTPATINQPEKPVASIEETLLFWQARASERLNAEDARQMIENITGFFAQLSAWDGEGQAVARPKSKVTEILIEPRAIDESLCNPVHSSLAA